MKKVKTAVLLVLASSLLTASAVSIRVENFTTNSVPALIENDDTYTFPPGVTDFSIYSTNVAVNINADEGWVCRDGYGFGDNAHVILRLSTRYGDTRASLFEVTRPSPEFAHNTILGVEQEKMAYAGVGGLGILLGLAHFRRKQKKA